MKTVRLLLAALPLVACQVLAGLDEPLEAPTADAGPAPAPDGPVATEDGAVGSPYAAAILVDRPVAYWRLDEKSGVRCADASGNDNAVTISGSGIRNRAGLVRGAGASAGLGDGAEILLDPRFDFGLDAEFTIEFWFRPKVPGSNGPMLTNLAGSAGTLVGSTLYLSQTGPVYMGYERWSGELFRYAHAVEPITFSARGFLHVAIVTRAGQASLFIDGTKYGGGSGPQPTTFTASSLKVGELAGDYDELAIYDRALSDQRVAAHYGAGVD